MGRNSRVHGGDERLRLRLQLGWRCQPRDYWFKEVWPESRWGLATPLWIAIMHIQGIKSPFLVKCARQQVSESLWRDLSLLLHSVHVDSKAQLLAAKGWSGTTIAYRKAATYSVKTSVARPGRP